MIGAWQQLEPINSHRQTQPSPANQKRPTALQVAEINSVRSITLTQSLERGRFGRTASRRPAEPADHITVGNCSRHYNDVPRPWTIGRAYSTKSSINTGQAPTNNAQNTHAHTAVWNVKVYGCFQKPRFVQQFKAKARGHFKDFARLILCFSRNKNYQHKIQTSSSYDALEQSVLTQERDVVSKVTVDLYSALSRVTHL